MSRRRHQIDFAEGDDVAIAMSLCCFALGLAWPLVLFAMPALLTPGEGRFHQFLGTFSMLLSILVLVMGHDQHRKYVPAVPGVTGIVLMMSSVFCSTECCSAVHAWAAGSIQSREITLGNWLTFSTSPCGAVLMIGAHLKNRQLLKNRRPTNRPHRRNRSK